MARRCFKRQLNHKTSKTEAKPIETYSNVRTMMDSSLWSTNIQGQAKAIAQSMRPMQPSPEKSHLVFKKGDIPKHKKGVSLKVLVDAGLYDSITGEPTFTNDPRKGIRQWSKERIPLWDAPRPKST